MLATAVAAYIVLLGAHARGLAGYWRTVPVMERRRAARRSACPTTSCRSGCCTSATRARSSASPSARRSRRSRSSWNELGSQSRMAPRSIWNGTITFGLVNVPVKVYSATESKSIHFHQVHLNDGARIEHRARLPEGGQGGAQRRDRQGLRALQRRVRRADQGRDRGRRGRERSKLIDVEHFVRGRGDRPGLLRQDLLPRRGRRRRGRVPAAAQGAGEVRQGRDRPLGLPRPRAAGRRPPARRRPRRCTR